MSGWAAATARRPVELWKPVAVLRIQGGVGFGGVREDREAHSHDDRGEDDAGEDDGPVTGHIAEDGAKYGEDDQHTHDRDLGARQGR